MSEQIDRRSLVVAGSLGLAGLAGTLAPEAGRSQPAEPALAARLARLEAVHQIQNIMGRYSFLHTAGMHKESGDLFALKTPGVRAEMMWGIYEGEAGIRKLYPGFHEWADGDRVGRMHQHTLTTPVIEVAGDLKTAKAVWIAPGHETGKFGPENKISANWAWMKYACDFIQEEGQWKIWHLHVYGLFLAPYHKSWVEAPDDMNGDMGIPPEFAPDKPPTTHWEYRPDRKTEYVPAPPAPYQSFDPSSAY